MRKRLARSDRGDRQGDRGRAPRGAAALGGRAQLRPGHEDRHPEARGTFVICDEIDLCDTEFYARALALLERTDTDLVVGSKCMVGSNDQRPLVRRLATRVYNQLLRVACGYKGTDTHGLKAFAGRRWWRPRGAACSTGTSSRASS